MKKMILAVMLVMGGTLGAAADEKLYDTPAPVGLGTLTGFVLSPLAALPDCPLGEFMAPGGRVGCMTPAMVADMHGLPRGLGWWSRTGANVASPHCPEGEHETASGWSCGSSVDEVSSLMGYPADFTCPMEEGLNVEQCLSTGAVQVLMQRSRLFVVASDDDYLRMETEYAGLKGNLEKLLASIDDLPGASSQHMADADRAKRLIAAMGKVREHIDTAYDEMRSMEDSLRRAALAKAE